MDIQRSQQLYANALRLIPGGVSSPVRAFRAVGGQPLFVQRGAGAWVWDADGNSFIDYVSSWGPLIAGHAHPQVVAALKDAVERGTSYGAPTELEIELAGLINAALPAVELVRFVNSGTEATMSALRLARAFTGRDKIIKFDGLLPRPCGRPAGEGGIGRGYPRTTGQSRRAGVVCRAHFGSAL